MSSVWVVWSYHAPAHGTTSAISPHLLIAAAVADVSFCLRLIGWKIARASGDAVFRIFRR